MSHLRPLAAAILAITLSCAAYAPAKAGGGRGGGGGSSGGGASYSGGAGMRAGNGPDFDAGAARFGGGTRADEEGPRFDPGMGDGGAHLGGRHFAGDGERHFSSSSAGPHFAGRTFSHSSDRPSSDRPGSNRTGRDRTRLSTIGGNRSNGGNAAQRLLNSHAMVNALQGRDALRDPGGRARIVAAAAIAGRLDRNEHGWWRHRHGGYGWVGLLFWPFAYYDVYDYVMWGYGDGPGFWDYGYNDIYAGIFTPYDYDDLTGYLPPGAAAARAPQASRAAAGPVKSPAIADPATSQATARPATSQAIAQPAASKAIIHLAPNHLAQMCGEDSRDIAGLPIDQIQRAIAPNAAQVAALDDLGNASMKAAQDIRAACPTQISANAPARLAIMQQRVEAMIAAVGTVRPALDKFYGLLNDGQKARLNGIGPNQGSRSAAPSSGGSLVRNCGSAQPGATDWPTAEIEAKLHLTNTQRANLTAVVDAGAKASDMLKDACQSDVTLTPPARLAAIGKRLDIMLLAIKTVQAALDDFYDQLTEEQKAQFETIGPGRTAVSAGAAEAGEQTAAPAR
jgi:hypothetical protein